MKRRTLLALAPLALAAGCGFQLRKAPHFAFDILTLHALPGSPIAAELKRRLTEESDVRVLTTSAATPAAPGTPAAPAASAPVTPPSVVLDFIQEQREKVVVGLGAAGQVREFQLRLRLRFKVQTPQGRELIPDTELLQQRDMSFDESLVLAKEAEEALLYRDMQADIVQQLLRRLAAIRGV